MLTKLPIKNKFECIIMILFIHSTATTRSIWLAQIRAILALGSEFGDTFLLDLFTISLPGHPDNDADFEFKDFRVKIEKFIEKNQQNQEELAKKLILSHDNKILKLLQDEKLVIFGYGIGGNLTLEYTIKNPEKIKKLVLISSGYKKNLVVMWLTKLFLWIFSKTNTNALHYLSRISPTLELRMLFNIMAENTLRKGLKSCLKYLESFDFEKLYSHSSINQQLSFNKIPILMIHGSYDLITPSSLIEKFQSIIDTEIASLKDKNTVINEDSKSENLNIIKLKTGHNPMFGSFASFVWECKNFLEIKN